MRQRELSGDRDRWFVWMCYSQKFQFLFFMKSIRISYFRSFFFCAAFTAVPGDGNSITSSRFFRMCDNRYAASRYPELGSTIEAPVRRFARRTRTMFLPGRKKVTKKKAAPWCGLSSSSQRRRFSPRHFLRRCFLRGLPTRMRIALPSHILARDYTPVGREVQVKIHIESS